MEVRKQFRVAWPTEKLKQLLIDHINSEASNSDSGLYVAGGSQREAKLSIEPHGVSLEWTQEYET